MSLACKHRDVAQPAGQLPKRDYFILPGIVLITVLLLAGVSETTSRYMFAAQEHDTCLIPDAVIGHRAKPNCVSHYKLPETPWIENAYNECGYRTRESCGPVTEGGIRGAIIGSSLSAGYMVPYEDTFAAQAAKLLTERCGRHVEFQNLGGINYHWDRLYARATEALALKPRVLVMTITPYDLLKPYAEYGLAKPDLEEDATKPQRSPIATLLHYVRGILQTSSTWVAFQYYRDMDTRSLLAAYLRSLDSSDYLRPPFSPAWKQRIEELNLLLGRIAEKSHAAGVPLVLVYVPLLPQALLLIHNKQYPGLFPTALDDTLAAAAASKGIGYIDLNREIQKTGEARKLFYTVNDHLTPAGHGLVADLLVAQLLASDAAEFPGCRTH